jgi:3-hydroxyacyl-CoA dehydrogenase/enoyl-CoA hydratase/3-hydroxybutyryl-CoA epimerase
MSYTHFNFELDADGIALITFDSPNVSMNVLSGAVMAEMGDMVEKIASDDAIKGAVITSGKKAFCAGADLSELGGGMGALEGKSEDEAKAALFEMSYRLNQSLRNLETCGKPIAAAINGLALGGGFEVTLACHYRVMADDTGAKLGLPEALVGVLPGGGGTQRLPRLTGVMNAAPVMLQGAQLDAAKAKAQGVIHDHAPLAEIVDRAKALVKEDPMGAKQPWDQDKFKIPGGGPFHPAGMQVFGGASPMLRKETYGNYPAQRYILSCVYEGLQVPIDAGLRIESRYFTKLLMRPESRNMIRSLFLSKQALEKGARRPAGESKAEVKKIAVIGAGFMGAGIATVSAQAGIEVVLIDVNQEGADKGKAHVVKHFEKGLKRGKLTQEAFDAKCALVTPTTDYAAMKDVDLVIEAVFENSELKHSITKASEEHIPETAIFGSNTSTIPITSLAKASSRPENFIGVHFFSPVEKMMLVELIVGEKTGARAISLALDYAGKIKKTPIVVADTRGFYANRCVMRYIEQGYAMLTEGVKPALIENAARMAGMPVGPLSLQDEVAIDLGFKVMTQTKKDLGDDYVEGPTDAVITSMYNAERYGRKNGKGFYVYTDAGKHLWEDLDQFAPGGKVLDEQPSVDELKERILYAQAIEAARTMAEDIVADPREADVGSILAWGFAPYTGGVLSYIDTIGAANFVARADDLHAKYGAAFEVPVLLREMASGGETFYGRFSPEAVAAE